MNINRLDAGQGVAWITQAAQLLLRNPTPFALMGLVVAVGAMVPVLGGLALAIFGPALNGGIMTAARDQAAGRTVDFQQLFEAFRQPGKLPKMVMLCLPAVIAGGIVVVLAVLLIGSALLAAGVSAATDANALAGISLGFGGLLFAALALAIGLAAFALVFFATTRVMLHGVEPVQAMKDSWQASLANVGPLLIYLVLLFVSMLVLHMVFGWISVLLTQLALVTVYTPLAATAMLLASEQVFGSEQPPSAPPPVIEV